MYLSRKGYVIPKIDLTKSKKKELINDLTMKPFTLSDFKQDKSFPLYLESKNKYYIPKYFGLKYFGEGIINKLTKGDDIDIEFNGSLRDPQSKIVDLYMKTCNEDKFSNDYSNGGMISLQCGGGKTVIALNIITKLKKKTLVVVHKTFLMDQWKDRIMQFIPNAKIGFIQGPDIIIEDCDIVIGMLQSLSQKDYDKNQFDSFGLCIIDEAHHIGAEVFSRSLRRISSWYMLGLSATPKRKDGLSKVFEYYIGPYIFKQTESEKREVDVNILTIGNNNNYQEDVLNYMGKVCMPKMINNICEYLPRTKFICKLVKYIIEEGTDNTQILILSDRRNHLNDIYNIIEANKICSVGYYVGGMKELELKKSESKSVILGTYSMSSEGMDIPTLNTLILSSPKSDIQQSVGRILRKKGEILPTVYDINDNFSSFKNQVKKRKTFYKKCNFKQFQIELDLNNYKDVKSLFETREQITFNRKSKKKDFSECIL
tara:strand:+ start:172 stop:1626 length:1455 start_codon:yes stop_codon:yes gene_type:complete